MRKFSMTPGNFWLRPDVRRLSASGKLLAAYVSTTGHGSMIGTFALPVAYAAADLAVDIETVDAAMRECVRGGALEFDFDAQVVRVPHVLFTTPITSWTTALGAFDLWQTLPDESPLKAQAATDLIGQRGFWPLQSEPKAAPAIECRQRLEQFVAQAATTASIGHRYPATGPSSTTAGVVDAPSVTRPSPTDAVPIPPQYPIASQAEGVSLAPRHTDTEVEVEALTKLNGMATKSETQPLALAMPSGTASAPAKQAAAQSREAITTPTWQAYSDAYARVHGAAPARSARANAQIKQFIEQVGIDDAPAIAAHFLTMNTKWYREKQHPLGSLVTDAQAIRTSWLTGRTVTSTEALLADRTQSNFNAFAPLMAEARAAEGGVHEA